MEADQSAWDGDGMDWRGFARQMATMARDLLAQPSVDATLE
ncbi:hypothetical protein [Streptomyces aureus]